MDLVDQTTDYLKRLITAPVENGISEHVADRVRGWFATATTPAMERAITLQLAEENGISENEILAFRPPRGHDGIAPAFTIARRLATGMPFSKEN